MKIILWSGELYAEEEVRVAKTLGVRIYVYQKEFRGDLYHRIKLRETDNRNETLVLLEDMGKSNLSFEDLRNAKTFDFNIEEVRTDANLIEYLEENLDYFENLWVEDIEENRLFEINKDESGYETISYLDSHTWFKFASDGSLIGGEAILEILRMNRMKYNQL